MSTLANDSVAAVPSPMNWPGTYGTIGTLESDCGVFASGSMAMNHALVSMLKPMPPAGSKRAIQSSRDESPPGSLRPVSTFSFGNELSTLDANCCSVIGGGGLLRVFVAGAEYLGRTCVVTEATLYGGLAKFGSTFAVRAMVTETVSS